MYLNEHLLRRLAHDRRNDLLRSANRERLLASSRSSFRHRLARLLVSAAERLEPNVATGPWVSELRHDQGVGAAGCR
jgi:hypothetical protein